MDVDGGMATNVYDSMAEGVANAFCVVAFMSVAYEASEKCVAICSAWWLCLWLCV